MKKMIATIAVALTGLASSAMADSLSVTAGAALEGAFGLAVFHDNSSSAYVQDRTPTAESVYRAEFLFDPNDFGTPATSSFRTPIFQATAFNPNPGVGACPNTTFLPALRVFVQYRASDGQYFMQGIVQGRLCGGRAIFFGPSNDRRVAVNNEPMKVCVEVTTGNSNTGRGRLTVVDDAASCPTSGDGLPWGWREVTNNTLEIDRVRMGATSQNNFGAGENGTMYFDSFASFRTLSP